MSVLSTTAIKDGQQGRPQGRHAHHSSTSSNTTLEAERADRISRLAGLERVATTRGGPETSGQFPLPLPGTSYLDSPGQVSKERSTVGSASATASIGGHTTWASSSDVYDEKMGEDREETDSVSNISYEGNASLVDFGEGANSTISGPTSRPPGLNRISSGGPRPPSMGSMPRPDVVDSYLQQQQHRAGERSMESPSPAGSNTPEPPTEDARMVDGMTFDPDVVDTTARTPRLATPSGVNRTGSPGRD